MEELAKMRSDVKIFEVQVKEKEQELKLADIKETIADYPGQPRPLPQAHKPCLEPHPGAQAL